ncbi:hypothetical protein JOB18_001918 [Solea senegalensis]|uniref:Uncharacterized protein n=1 Tax=Solea senegalensis TaxID=28829 RepID=A0AAV6QTV9_SOLSE|nr:hypothetical protein JOB18_001918 [Solea senegalensis]
MVAMSSSSRTCGFCNQAKQNDIHILLPIKVQGSVESYRINCLLIGQHSSFCCWSVLTLSNCVTVEINGSPVQRNLKEENPKPNLPLNLKAVQLNDIIDFVGDCKSKTISLKLLPCFIKRRGTQSECRYCRYIIFVAVVCRERERETEVNEQREHFSMFAQTRNLKPSLTKHDRSYEK